MTQPFVGAIPIDSSDEVFIRLEMYHDVQWSFRRSNLNYYFPQSLLSTTLELDPTAKEITLTNKDVTPTVISILYIIYRILCRF